MQDKRHERNHGRIAGGIKNTVTPKWYYSLSYNGREDLSVRKYLVQRCYSDTCRSELYWDKPRLSMPKVLHT